MHRETSSERDTARLPADARDYFGEGTVDESSILSPGVYGRVFNPIVAAEFRRWRARPVTYMGMVLATFLGICFVYFGRGGLPLGVDHPFLAAVTAATVKMREWLLSPLPATGSWRGWGNQYLNLILRPSTILPLMMVWRALVSFRDGGLYRPFRTTFLSPSEFLWGMIAVPFFAGALLLTIYTGGILGPGIVTGYHSRPPGYPGSPPHPVVQVAGILFEGGMNGALICFVALYCALLWNARPAALVPVVLCVLALQAAQCAYQLSASRAFVAVFGLLSGGAPEDPFAPPTPAQRLLMSARAYENLFFLFSSGIAKLLACLALWPLCRLQLRRTEDELPLTPRRLFRAAMDRRRRRRAARMAA